MAYTIRYGPAKRTSMGARLLWTLFFFALFLVTANVLFPDQLALLRETVFPQAAAAFFQELLPQILYAG